MEYIYDCNERNTDLTYCLSIHELTLVTTVKTIIAITDALSI